MLGEVLLIYEFYMHKKILLFYIIPFCGAPRDRIPGIL